MTSRFMISRRQTLRQFGLALGSAVLSAAAQAVPIRGCSAADVELAAVADRLLAHRQSAAVIGACYLAKFDSEASAELLAKAIRNRLPDDRRPIDEQTLLALIQLDFERGEIVNLQGWMLSRTEARLCALFA